MKHTAKFFALLLSALLLLTTLSACSEKINTNNMQSGTQNAPQRPTLDWAADEGLPSHGTPNESSPDSDNPDFYGGIITNATLAGTNSSESEQDRPPRFTETAIQAISTFSADVDTASYSYFRKVVNASYGLPDLQRISSAFRVEEFLNYFKYNVATPAEGALFGVTSEIAVCPWNPQTMLLRLSLQAPAPAPTAGNNLVFLIDVSGSMMSEDKLPLLKTAFTYLVGNLGANDTVSIVTYSGKEEVVLDGCSGLESARILDAINSLTAYGVTNGEAGLTEAYRIAEKHMVAGGNNRIILASDGDLNVGIATSAELKSFVEGKRDAGIYLSVLGFGGGNYRDANMEALADNGNGVYYYIDGTSEAEKVFGTDLLGTLYTVAKDVKLQIKFDPEYISEYRLIGYENRILSAEDFEDDTKDAGDVGAGHQVTVCYELKCTEKALSTLGSDWMELSMRYKLTDALISSESKLRLGAANRVSTPSDDLCFLSCVIRTVSILRSSSDSAAEELAQVLSELNDLNLEDHPDRAEFRDLIDKLV